MCYQRMMVLQIPRRQMRWTGHLLQTNKNCSHPKGYSAVLQSLWMCQFSQLRWGRIWKAILIGSGPQNASIVWGNKTGDNSKVANFKYFNPSKDNIKIQCNAWKGGIGAAVLQKGRPIHYVSKAITLAENSYSKNIEWDMLFVSLSVQNFMVESNHQPLMHIYKKEN